jgi:aspartokinase/homoserine dehydrogenase 1
LTSELDQVERLMQGIRLLGLCPDNVQARILSRGENLSIAFMHELLRVRGIELDLIVPEQLLVTDGGYLEAHVDIEASRVRFAAKGLRSDCLYLMPGFTGGSDKGETVLLGRNGSDYSAAVLAACVDAECCEIWTDVEGCYNCDPRLVPDAYLLKTLSYKEAMELSYFGAKVLHPKTIAPVAQFHIPCLIKNSFNPQGPGTLIGVDQGDDDLKVKAISDLSGMCMFNVSGPGMKGMVGMAGRIFSAVSRAGVSIVLITQSSSEYSVSFCIHSYDSDKTRKVLEREFELEFKNQLLDPLEIMTDLAIISSSATACAPPRGWRRASSPPGPGLHQHRRHRTRVERALHLRGRALRQGGGSHQGVPPELLWQPAVHRSLRGRGGRRRCGPGGSDCPPAAGTGRAGHRPAGGRHRQQPPDGGQQGWPGPRQLA